MLISYRHVRMMFSPPIIGGLLAVLTMGTIPTVSGQSAPSLYNRIKQITEKEVRSDVEPPLAQFVVRLMKDKYNITYTEEDISLAVAAPASFLGRCGRQVKQVFHCQEQQGEIAHVVKREQRVRKIGRDLFLSTTGYEMPIREHLGTFAALPPAFGSLLNIWQSGSDRAVSGGMFIHMTAAPFPQPQSTLNTKYADVETALKKLIGGSDTKEQLAQLAGAVTRYRFGYRNLRSTASCTPENSTGTDGELGILSQRWCDVEDKLNAVWKHLNDSLQNRDPPVNRSEVVLFPTWAYRKLNVVVWVTNRDAGLDWEFPLEPVLPRLMDDRGHRRCIEEGGVDPYCSDTYWPQPLLGGTTIAPPETPGNGVGVCAMPVGSRGFLCRTLEQKECAVSYPNTTGSGGIYLGKCKEPILQTPVRMTLSGPDICGIGGWKLKTESPTETDTPSRQDILPGSCSNCSVDLYCSSSCPGGNGFTEQRQANGVIHVCIPNAITSKNGTVGTAYYDALILHELTRAQQQCSNPRSLLTGSLEQCCSAEYQAYLVSCTALAEDGILEDLHVQYRGKELPLSPEFCAATLSTLSCKTLGQCSDSPIAPSIFVDKLFQAQNRNEARLGLSTSCAAAINNLDPRAKAIVASFPRACTPQCRSAFENTIGNNLCYIGQCIEQSWEEERIVPGRMTFNVADESFPWDSCVGREPAANTDPPAASRFVLPTLAFPTIPEYRPWDAAQITDRALCQMLGLPARTPPTLCQGEVSTQIGRPLSDPLDMMIVIARAMENQLDPARDLERMAPSVGTRYATSLYQSQTGPLRRAYSDIFDAASLLLEEISSTKFPEYMCSRVDRACPYIPSNSAAN